MKRLSNLEKNEQEFCFYIYSTLATADKRQTKIMRYTRHFHVLHLGWSFVLELLDKVYNIHCKLLLVNSAS